MVTYRAYLLNPAGKITFGKWIEAHTRAEAESKAVALCDGGSPTVELWQGVNHLATLSCDDGKPT